MVTLLRLSLKSGVIEESVLLRRTLSTDDLQQDQATQTSATNSRRPWLVVSLLFVVALINYFDRQSLSVVAPRFQQELHLSDQGYGHIVSLFLLASAFAYAISGFISDALGTRRSMALFVGWWSLAEAATAFATSTFQLSLTRFCLGLGEPGLWVAAPKAVGESFERPRRGFAIGIYTMGATVGAVVAIPVIAAVTSHLPWRTVFLIDGAAGLLWLLFWLFGYQDAPVAKQANGSGVLREVLSRGKTWKLMIARGLTDPVWYFYLFWFPKYLLTSRHLSMVQLAKIGWIVYLTAGIGTLLGGLVSGWLIRRGMTAGFAYRRVMLFAAILIPLSPLAGLAPTVMLAVGIASVIAFAHMAWLVNLTSTIVELFPANQVGKAAGLVAAGSGFGGMISSEIIGYFVTHQGYLPVFFIMALLHPIALIILWKAFADTPQPGPALAGAPIITAVP
jgi:MFS transporter, ACS family, hexuronate transporter